MNPDLIILLILFPMAAGVASLLVSGRPRLQLATGIAGLAANAAFAIAVLVATGSLGGSEARILVSQIGDWPAPFGITIVVDPLAALMICVTSIVLLATFVYCIEQLTASVRGPLFTPLFLFLGLGVQWSFLAADLFNLFVAFEIMLMASYALLVVGGSEPQMRQAFKYVLLNLIASLLFVTCCGLLYGHVGTLNMADLARLSHAGQFPAGAVPTIAVLLLVFGLKSAVFPLWFWLPDTYHTLPAALGGLFGGLLTKVGAYVLIRVFVMTFGPADGVVADVVRSPLLVIAGLTMFIGVLGAVSMGSIRRILSIHIISQVGYMVLAVGLGIGLGLTPQGRELAVAGGIFFILHNMVVKSALFLCGGLMCRAAGSDELDRMGGLARKSPWLAALFMIAALSLAGLPPLSGFFAKFVLVRESFDGGYAVLAAVALATSVLTLLSMLKIWCYACWSRPQTSYRPPGRSRASLGMAAVAALVLFALLLGLGAERCFRASQVAAKSVVDPRPYMEAVLGPEQIRPIRTVDQIATKRGALP